MWKPHGRIAFGVKPRPVWQHRSQGWIDDASSTTTKKESSMSRRIDKSGTVARRIETKDGLRRVDLFRRPDGCSSCRGGWTHERPDARGSGWRRGTLPDFRGAPIAPHKDHTCASAEALTSSVVYRL
jgi:hypothetical protein